MADDGDLRAGRADTLGPLPVVSLDQVNAPSVLTPPQAFRGFAEFGGRHGTNWVNPVTRETPPAAVPFSAYLTVPFIEAPVPMMVGRDDELVHCNPDMQRTAFEEIAGPGEWVEISGGHFGLLWRRESLLGEAVHHQVDFLKRTLADRSPACEMPQRAIPTFVV